MNRIKQYTDKMMGKDKEDTHHQKCACCSGGLKAFLKIEQKNIKRFGFSLRILTEEIQSGYRLSYTKGLTESFGHVNLQMVAGLEPVILGKIFFFLVDKIKEGHVFKDGEIVNDVCGEPLCISLAEVNHQGEHQLRIIVPDPNGNVTRETMAAPFNCQFTMQTP